MRLLFLRFAAAIAVVLFLSGCLGGPQPEPPTGGPDAGRPGADGGGGRFDASAGPDGGVIPMQDSGPAADGAAPFDAGQPDGAPMDAPTDGPLMDGAPTDGSPLDGEVLDAPTDDGTVADATTG